MTDNELWLVIRQALLLVVDAIERKLGMERTSELRKLAELYKRGK